jgi:flagellar biosynthesis protein FlhG
MAPNDDEARRDQDLGHCIKSVCHKYFDLEVDFVGAIDYDNAVWQSARIMQMSAESVLTIK